MAWIEYIVQRDVRAATSEKYENNAALAVLSVT